MIKVTLKSKTTIGALLWQLEKDIEGRHNLEENAFTLGETSGEYFFDNGEPDFFFFNTEKKTLRILDDLADTELLVDLTDYPDFIIFIEESLEKEKLLEEMYNLYDEIDEKAKEIEAMKDEIREAAQSVKVIREKLKK